MFSHENGKTGAQTLQESLRVKKIHNDHRPVTPPVRATRSLPREPRTPNLLPTLTSPLSHEIPPMEYNQHLKEEPVEASRLCSGVRRQKLARNLGEM